MALRMEQLIAVGILLIILGFIIIFASMFWGAKDANSRTKVAVGGFIGPIPFGFGNDKNLVWMVTIISIVFFLIWLIFNFRK